jgi:hypothetical protein
VTIDFTALLTETGAKRQRPAYLIIGSRAFAGSLEHPDPGLIQLVWDYVDTLPANALVISGGAPGPDSWAVEAAAHFAIETRVYRPQWKRADGSINRGAGFRRNEQMSMHLAAWPGSKHCTAFWDGVSSGTGHTIGYVRALGWCEPLIVSPVVPPWLIAF